MTNSAAMLVLESGRTTSRQKRHRHADDLLQRVRRGDKSDVKWKRDDRDTRDEHGMREHREPGPVLDHQYWTFRSTNRNCTTVSAITISIRTADCAEEPPRSAAFTPS